MPRSSNKSFLIWRDRVWSWSFIEVTRQKYNPKEVENQRKSDTTHRFQFNQKIALMSSCTTPLLDNIPMLSPAQHGKIQRTCESEWINMSTRQSRRKSNLLIHQKPCSHISANSNKKGPNLIPHKPFRPCWYHISRLHPQSHNCLRHAT